jgi:hypothetical protein
MDGEKRLTMNLRPKRCQQNDLKNLLLNTNQKSKNEKNKKKPVEKKNAVQKKTQSANITSRSFSPILKHVDDSIISKMDISRYSNKKVKPRQNSETPIIKDVKLFSFKEISPIKELADNCSAIDINLSHIIDPQKEKIKSMQSKFTKLKKHFTEKIIHLEKELRNLKSIETRVKGVEEQLAKRKKPTKRQKKEVTEEAMKALSLKISNELNPDQKRDMREVIKDYIKIESNGMFNFSLDSLPQWKFFELQKYVDKCFTQNINKKKPRLTVNCNEDTSLNVI